MKKCTFGAAEVDAGLVRANSIGFGKKLDGALAIPFVIEVDASDAIAAFSAYYQEFVDRESEDEGFDEELEGIYLQLKESGYLSFEQMVAEQPGLLSQVLAEELPSEFLGYVFLDKEASTESKKYILQKLTEVQILGEKIICTGFAFINLRFATM